MPSTMGVVTQSGSILKAENGFVRGQRNTAIVKARLGGLSESFVAEKFGVSERQVRRVLEDYRASCPPLGGLDPEGIVVETLDGYGEAIEQLAEIAATSDHDGARLGAVRAQVEVHSVRLALLQALGALPQDLGRFRIELDVREAARTILEIFDRRGVPEDVQAEVVEAVEAVSPAALAGGG